MTVTSLKVTRRSNRYRRSKKNPKGTSYELKDIVSDIKWTTDLNFSAGELAFDLIQEKNPIIPYTGDIITFKWDKTKIFYGYVWKYTVKKDNTVSVTCYDKMRYLKNKDSIVFQTGTIADRFNNVTHRAGIKHKVVNSQTHKVAAEVCDGKTYFDMLKSAVKKHLKSTGHMYFLFTNYDTVELRKAPFKNLNLIVGSGSGATDYTYSVDINNTYNVIKVVQKNTKDSKSETATADTGDDPAKTSFTSKTVSGKSPEQWGVLRDVVSKKDKATWAQAIKEARDTLHDKNLANKTLSITCMGDLNLIPGNTVKVKLDNFDKTLSKCAITKATHNFGTDYTCELEMKVGTRWLENDS